MQTLIKNGILYTMTEDKGIFQGDILVEGTKIKEVAEHISEDCLEDGEISSLRQKDIMFFRDLSMHILTSDYLISMWIRV